MQKTRWFAIRPLLWEGENVKEGDLLAPAACDMHAKEVCGEVLGCDDEHTVARNGYSGKWEVVPLTEADAPPQDPKPIEELPYPPDSVLGNEPASEQPPSASAPEVEDVSASADMADSGMVPGPTAEPEADAEADKPKPRKRKPRKRTKASS